MASPSSAERGDDTSDGPPETEKEEGEGDFGEDSFVEEEDDEEYYSDGEVSRGSYYSDRDGGSRGSYRSEQDRRSARSSSSRKQPGGGGGAAEEEDDDEEGSFYSDDEGSASYGSRGSSRGSAASESIHREAGDGHRGSRSREGGEASRRKGGGSSSLRGEDDGAGDSSRQDGEASFATSQRSGQEPSEGEDRSMKPPARNDGSVDDRSYYSDERSYYSDERSHYSEERSYYSDERSRDSRDRSYRSENGSFEGDGQGRSDKHDQHPDDSFSNERPADGGASFASEDDFSNQSQDEGEASAPQIERADVFASSRNNNNDDDNPRDDSGDFSHREDNDGAVEGRRHRDSGAEASRGRAVSVDEQDDFASEDDSRRSDSRSADWYESGESRRSTSYRSGSRRSESQQSKSWRTGDDTEDFDEGDRFMASFAEADDDDEVPRHQHDDQGRGQQGGRFDNSAGFAAAFDPDDPGKDKFRRKDNGDAAGDDGFGGKSQSLKAAPTNGFGSDDFMGEFGSDPFGREISADPSSTGAFQDGFGDDTFESHESGKSSTADGFMRQENQTKNFNAEFLSSDMHTDGFAAMDDGFGSDGFGTTAFDDGRMNEGSRDGSVGSPTFTANGKKPVDEENEAGATSGDGDFSDIDDSRPMVGDGDYDMDESRALQFEDSFAQDDEALEEGADHDGSPAPVHRKDDSSQELDHQDELLGTGSPEDFTRRDREGSDDSVMSANAENQQDGDEGVVDESSQADKVSMVNTDPSTSVADASTDARNDQLQSRPSNVSFTINEPSRGKKTLIILCTMFPSSQVEVDDQDHAMKLCKANGIVPHILMGQQKPSQRDELLAVSKSNGFPQFFLYLNRHVEFLGDFVTVQQMDEYEEFNASMLEDTFKGFADLELETVEHDSKHVIPKEETTTAFETYARASDAPMEESRNSQKDDEVSRSQSASDQGEFSTSFGNSRVSVSDRDSSETKDDEFDHGTRSEDDDGGSASIATFDDTRDGSLVSYEETDAGGDQSFPASLHESQGTAHSACDESRSDSRTEQTSTQYGSTSLHSGYSKSETRGRKDDNSSVPAEEDEGDTMSSHGSGSEHEEPIPGNHSGSRSEFSASTFEPSLSAISRDKTSDEFEQSMMIGDVFGQPNELFEDFKGTQSSLASVGEEEEGSAAESEGGSKSLDSQDRDPDEEVISSPSRSKSVTKQSITGSRLNSRGDELGGNGTQARGTHEAASEKEKKGEKSRKKKRKKRRKQAKSAALLDFEANVNDAMLDLEEQQETKDQNADSSAHRLLHGFDALLGIFLQLSDELELISTFSKSKKKKEKEKEILAPVQALQAVLSFAETFDQLFADLKPIILDCFVEEPDEVMDDLLYGLNSLVDLLCETTHRVGDRQEWNERAETTYVTLLELMERDSLDLRCYFEDIDTPDQGLSANIHEAWSATGHIEELRALQYADDPWLFRQICYEVMVSTDQWCPDTGMLMEICGIDHEMLEEEPDQEYLDEDELAPIPQAAEHVLDKVNGDPLPRPAVLASILRRILPPRAVTDATLLDNFTSIRNTLQNPLGLSATNIVSISSVPEALNDPDSLGVGGMGKTTLAAMVAQHPDVRRYFIDGVVWVYVGDKELNYGRYTQCLRELVAQLDFYQGVPLFAELLDTPGETLSKRRRREEGFMIYARDTIAELLHDRSVLIILDDVCFEPDLDWFDFAPMPGESTDNPDGNCALLVTTRCRSLLPAADTVEVDMLDEADAISLLIQESGQLSHALMAESREARSVVRECANHPLAVKSVGRWLNLKHATAGVVSSVEEIHAEVIKSMDKILKGGDHTGADMMYEVLSMSLSPAINGEPTSIIKFCLAAFIVVFCDREYISDFALTEPTPIIPMDMAELLFETLLEMNEGSLLQKGSPFYAQKKEAAVLIPEALSALGVLKVITYSDAEDEVENPEDEQKFLQVMHFIHHEYGEYLAKEDIALQDLTKDAERQWNRALVEAYLSHVEEWDMDLEDAAHSYSLEMIPSHMIRGGMYSAAADLLADKRFVRGRLLSLGRENSSRRHIKDCEMLFTKLRERRPRGSKLEPRSVMKQAYQALGSQLAIDDEEQSPEDSRIKDVEVARAHYEIGFSLSEKRCWDAAIAHWETSQELLVSALGTVEVVAGILFNIGVVYSEMNEYEQALDSLKQCLRIRGTIHGEEHILYAQTIQRIGDIFLNMSDYHEAQESYDWALDVMYREPSHHRVEIGEILDNKGTIHYSKGEIDEALQCHQEALRSKQVDLGEDHPELAATYHHIGNCLSDQGNVDDAIVHFEEAIRLKELDPEGGPERDADVLTIEGILHNLEGNQEQGLECYEKSLQILVTKVPHRKEKVASLLHLIGCVYLMSGEQKKAMKLFEESLQARRKVLGFVHLDVASTLFNMAFLHQTRNRLDKALKCLEEALKIRQLRLPDSEKVAVTHEKIGSLARAIGKTKKAQIAFEEALRIRRLIHGEQHEAVATVLQELGDLMDDLGEYDSAMSYYIDALDIRRNRLGLDDIAVAETLYSMGYTLHNNDEPERALVCFEESLSIRRYQLGEDSKEVGDTLNMMGFLKAKRGELDDALTLLWDALRIRKLQEDHLKVSETLKNIGNVHREKQEQELAVECYEESLRIRRGELGNDHEKVADALIAMGNVQSDMERIDEAMRSYQEALKIRTLVFGEHDESVAAVLQYMGTMEFRSNNHAKARDLLTEFIRIRRDNGTKNDGDFVNVLFMIGNIHKMQGHEAEARQCWTESYAVFQELGLAETNPQIAKVMNHLLEVENLDEPNTNAEKKSIFGKVTEKFKKEKNQDEVQHQKTRKNRRSKGKGFKL